MKLRVTFGLLLILAGPSWQELARNPLLHSATDREVVLRQEDGSYKLAYDAEDGFRAESRGKDGVVKGVFGHRSPSGKLVTQTYLSDDQGFRLAPLTELGVELPPLPYYLQPKAGQRKFPKESDEAEKEKVQVKERAAENPSGWGGLKLTSSYINGRLDDAADAVVLEPLDVETEDQDVVEVGEERPFGALAGRPGNQEQSSQWWSQIQASAVAGDGGVAQAGAQGSAFVGRGGVAVATVMGTVQVGPGGVAISTPVEGGSAGNGGIAIAGAQGLTISAPPSALPSPGDQGSIPVYQQQFNIPAETAPALTRPLDLPLPEGAKITAYPIVANYFFSYPQQSQNPQQSQQATKSYYPSQSQYPQQTEFQQPPRPLPYGENPQAQYYPPTSHNLKDQSVSKSLGGADGQSRQAGQPLYRHHQIVVVPWVQH